jgi:hypothetical protein
MKKLQILLVLAVAVSAQANTGFKKLFHFPSTGPSRHWIALPYSYSPEDAGVIGTLDVQDLCNDLGGATKVLSIEKWDESTSTFTTWTCGAAGTPFTLTKGTAYAVNNQPGQTIKSAIVGAHDDAYTFSIASTGGSSLSWIGVPYHRNFTDNAGTPAGLDAEDLCRSIDSAEVWAVVRWDTAASRYVTYGCGSAFSTPFPITLGEGYAVVNVSGQTISWLPPHF